jgi:predicted nucleic acid-binding protein
LSFVLDTSVSLAWCFKDEQTGPIMALLDRVTASGAHVPGLWPIEAVNVLLTAERRRRVTALQREQLLGFLRELPIAVDQETADRIWQQGALLAARHGLTAYDAAYLELALRLDLPLASADSKLADAARRCGVSVLPAK